MTVWYQVKRDRVHRHHVDFLAEVDEVAANLNQVLLPCSNINYRVGREFEQPREGVKNYSYEISFKHIKRNFVPQQVGVLL